MKWPTNQKWRKFATRIADGVTLAIRTGDQISDKSRPGFEWCRCPLGAGLMLKALHVPFPTIDEWAEQFPGDIDLAMFFTEAFDGEPYLTRALGENDRAARRLGLWYRKKYLGENAVGRNLH